MQFKEFQGRGYYSFVNILVFLFEKKTFWGILTLIS